MCSRTWVGLSLIWVRHPPCPAASAKFPSAQAELGRQWNTQNSSQPNPVHEDMGRRAAPSTLETPYHSPTRRAMAATKAMTPTNVPKWQAVADSLKMHTSFPWSLS